MGVYNFEIIFFFIHSYYRHHKHLVCKRKELIPSQGIDPGQESTEENLMFEPRDSALG